MKKNKNNLPTFEDKGIKRDVEFFPDVFGCYAIRNSSVEHHSDSDGDPWSIFGPKGGHMATFCTRKSKISLWPFVLDMHNEVVSLHNVESRADCIKLARFSDIQTSLKNAARFAWLKWPYAHRVVGKNHFKNTVIKYYGSNGLFCVPYNVDREIYGANGAYMIFNSDGKAVGRVARDRHYEVGKKIFKGYYKFQGAWHEEIMEEEGGTAKEVLRNLLWIIEEETNKYVKHSF